MRRDIKEVLKFNNWLWKGDLLFHSPIGSILSGFYFEKSTTRKDEGFYIWKFNQPLFLYKEHLTFTYGERLTNNIGNQFWTIDEIKSTVIDLITAEKEELLDKEELKYFLSIIEGGNSIREIENEIYFSSIIDGQKTHKLYKKLLGRPDVGKEGPKWVKKILKELDEYLKLNLKERKNLLSANVKMTANKLGLSKYLLDNNL